MDTKYEGLVTRRMESVFNELDSGFRSLYSVVEYNEKLAELEKVGNGSARGSVLAELFEMLDERGIDYEIGKDNEYYKNIVKKADIPEFYEVEDEILYLLYTKYDRYPSPEDYMLKTVNKLSSPDDNWEGDTLRLRILKQFIKYGNYLTYRTEDEETGKTSKVTVYGGEKYIKSYLKEKTGKSVKSTEEVLENIDDGIFEDFELIMSQKREELSNPDLTAEQKKKLKNTYKASRKPTGPYGLIKLCDDLAQAKFRTGGATKKGLYCFAMVYNMTYFSGKVGEKPDYDSDLEKNLFRDYYTNNLMRFISSAYKGQLTEYDLNPSGQGINYKNFAEMIYVYFIAKDYSPAEKIKLSDEMIERVKKAGKNSEKKTESTKASAGETALFKARFFRDTTHEDMFSEDILNKSEAEFEKFIIDNYNCDTADNSGEMQLEAEQNTAFENYKNILEDLKSLGVMPEMCNYGLWFTDVAVFKNKRMQNICDRRKDINREDFSHFVDLLLAVNRFLGYTADEQAQYSTKQDCGDISARKTQALFVSEPKNVTRTDLIVAYYYYYNALHEDEEDMKGIGFKTFFGAFKNELDRILISSYYQPLSGKNIFDVLVAFSSYAYLND